MCANVGREGVAHTREGRNEDEFFARRALNRREEILKTAMCVGRRLLFKRASCLREAFVVVTIAVLLLSFSSSWLLSRVAGDDGLTLEVLVESGTKKRSSKSSLYLLSERE